MVIGLPGSGKSFFARQFAEMFNAPLVSVDYVRHTLFPDSHFNPMEDKLVNALTRNEISELFKTGKTFIIDGGMNSRASRLDIERLGAKHDYGKLTIWVQTDEPTSLARSLKRNAKKATDALNSSMDSQDFERYRKQFNVPTSAENVVVISGKHTYATQARVVLKKLVVPRDTTTVARTIHVERVEAKTEQHHDIQPRRRNVTIN